MNKTNVNRFFTQIGNSIRESWPEIQQRMRDERDAMIQDACFEERDNNIAKAALALLEVGASDDVVVQKLQEHWDLRRSETRPFLQWAHRQMEATA